MRYEKKVRNYRILVEFACAVINLAKSYSAPSWPYFRISSKYIDLDHIGKILQKEFMEPYKLSQNALVKAIGVAPSRITNIVNGHRTITADTDLRLTCLLGLSEGYFLRIQEHRNYPCQTENRRRTCPDRSFEGENGIMAVKLSLLWITAVYAASSGSGGEIAVRVVTGAGEGLCLI
jgi:addiction module HigA family antidote